MSELPRAHAGLKLDTSAGSPLVEPPARLPPLSRSNFALEVALALELAQQPGELQRFRNRAPARQYQCQKKKEKKRDVERRLRALKPKSGAASMSLESY